jgi:AcrR family transcriptional regulator
MTSSFRARPVLFYDPAASAMAQQERKRTQRARLLDGMVEASLRHGYGGASVSAVIAQAGVSRPTFYEYFSDREDCFVAAVEEVGGRVLDRASVTVAEAQPADALAAAVAAQIAFAQAERSAARFLTSESMAGGERALSARDHGIERLADLVREMAHGAPPDTALVDLDPRVVIGGVYRMLAIRLRRGEAALARLSDALAQWLAWYAVPSRARRWTTLEPGPTVTRSPHVPRTPIQRMPSVFGPGRTRAPEEEVVENHRQRILYAVGELAAGRGYAATSVADVLKLARVDGRTFYRLFSDKQEAFAAAHELGFQQVMDVTAKAFFSVTGWPERSWEAGRALTQLLDANPSVAHLGLVEAYAIGARAVQRVEDSYTAFMFFLQEGLMADPAEQLPSREAMEAIVATVFEVLYLQLRARSPRSAAMLPYISHVWLTPFVGVKESDRFIDAQLRRESSR